MRKVTTVFGLACDVEASETTQSGFQPANEDLGSGKELFGDLRLQGFAAMLRLGFAENLVVIGGKEGRFKDRDVWRAEAIREILIKDYGIDPSRVSALRSASNTGGNIARMKEVMAGAKGGSYAVVTSHYHIPRADVDLKDAGLFLYAYAAEAFILAERPDDKGRIIARLASVAERMGEEIQGIAHKVHETYAPKTDIQASAPKSFLQRIGLKT